MSQTDREGLQMIYQPSPKHEGTAGLQELRPPMFLCLLIVLQASWH